MKKLFLLMGIGTLAMNANAQQSTSILFSHQQATGEKTPLTVEQMNRMHNNFLSHRSAAAAKSTSGTYDDWYDMFDQNYQSGVSAYYYFNVFPDSNLLNGSNYVYMHGMGMSFDPTDSSYFDPVVNSGSCVTPVNYPMRLTGQIYTIDSVFIPAQYVRNDASITADSIIIELVVAENWTNDSGAYNLQFTTADPSFFPMAYDEKPRFSTVHYNGGVRPGYNTQPYINDCYFDSVLAPRQRYAFALTATTAADTTAAGYLALGTLPGSKNVNGSSVSYTPDGTAALHITPIVIDPTTGMNPHLVSFVSFKSGHTGGTYPHGTSINSANWLKLYAGSPLGASTFFRQNSGNASVSYKGSYQQGLVVYHPQRYDDTTFTFPHGAHNVLMPGCEFVGPDYMVTDQWFHITWTGVVSQTNSVKNIDRVSVFPNPANNVLNVNFSMQQNTEATVSLTNMVGQVVASQTVTTGHAAFNIASLPQGIYVYSIQSNGERTTGHVVIAH